MLFGCPAPSRPTCHKNHLPGFLAEEAAFKAKGVDEIAMTSVNDHFVLTAWSKATGSGAISRSSPTATANSRKRGRPRIRRLDRRSRRALQALSMLVEDGVVKLLNIEESPGKADLSGAAHLLAQI